jgi:hypothetical protein
MVKIEEVVFWILMISVIGVVIWMLSGSPPLENGLLMIMIFISSSMILLWKYIFGLKNEILKVDNKTSMGFVKVNHDLELMENRIINKLNNIENKIK